ncbi:MAG: DUF3558 domain-containing protein [Nocardiaceae bacterium]|nr:DUF3558 domain-containing protein [Nocardiaceae bacterium]
MRSILSVFLVGAALSGCAVQGKAVEAHFWDPCSELPAAALTAAGANPEKKNDDVQFPDWRMCSWPTVFANYWLIVASAEDPIAALESNPKYADFREVDINGRRGKTYVFAGEEREGCTVGFDTSYGSIHIEMTSEAGDDACKRATDASRKLLPSLPI